MTTQTTKALGVVAPKLHKCPGCQTAYVQNRRICCTTCLGALPEDIRRAIAATYTEGPSTQDHRNAVIAAHQCFMRWGAKR